MTDYDMLTPEKENLAFVESIRSELEGQRYQIEAMQKTLSSQLRQTESMLLLVNILKGRVHEIPPAPGSPRAPVVPRAPEDGAEEMVPPKTLPSKRVCQHLGRLVGISVKEIQTFFPDNGPPTEEQKRACMAHLTKTGLSILVPRSKSHSKSRIVRRKTPKTS